MKINIRDVFEKEEKNVRIHTNDRLDIDEVFAEAVIDETDTEQKLTVDITDKLEIGVQDDAEDIRDEVCRIAVSEADAGGEERYIEETYDEEADNAEISIKSEETKKVEICDKSSDKIEIADVSDITEETIDEAEESNYEIEGEENVWVCTEAAEIESELPEDENELLSCDTGEENQGEKKSPFYRKYLSQGSIAASFFILLSVVFIYTTMIPREVNATINGEDFTFSSKAHTVETFLEKEDIEFHDKDYISEPLTAFIHDGMEIEIDHATDFKVTADGETKSYKTLTNTVDEALKEAGVKVGAEDIVTPSMDSMLTKDMEIVVQRVVIKEEIVEETVPFETVEKNDSSLDEGKTKVVTEGSEGKDSVTYSVTYIDGVESSRKEISRTAVTAAVDKVIAKGTRISFDGKPYSRKLVVKAYAYTGGGRTAMGTRARVGEIAVDPSVIPLGSNVYIEGVGARRAEDTGGNIKGNTIDIYMDTQSQCISWGARYVTIYIQ